MYEFHPERYDDAFRETASRINHLAVALASRGVEFVVLILPFEMQISRDAAEKYAGFGVEWENDDFLSGSPQRKLLGYLDKAEVIDLYGAFVDPANAPASLSENGVGEYFVYLQGGSIDWNHPNRKGHRAIADFLSRDPAFRALFDGLSARPMR